MRISRWNLRFMQAVAGLLAVLLPAGCGANTPAASSDVSDLRRAGVSSLQSTDASDQQSADVSESASENNASAKPGTSSGVSTSKTIASSSSRAASAAASSKSVDLSMFPVTPKLTIQQSAAKVNNKLPAGYNVKKIASTFVRISEYTPEYAFTHHPGLAVFKGRLYACFSQGYEYEDTPGQRIVVASAPLNDIANWSKPVVAAAARKLSGGKEAFIIPGFLHVAGDKLLCFYMDKEYGPSAYDKNGNFIYTKGHHPQPTIVNYYRLVSTTDGVNWSQPVDIGIAANESPRKTLTGQLLAGAGNQLIFNAQSNPNGYYWKKIGMTSAQYQSSLNRGGLSLLTEASWYQTDDYIIHQMLRSHDGYVWMSESYNNGKTWTEAYPTNFTSDTTMAHFGRLPDGRYYFVGNPSYNSGRYPLALYISEDGYNFNQAYILRDEKYVPKKDNWTKIGAVAYPEVLIDGGYMYIIHSQYKEIMSLTRVKLSDIK